MKTLKHIPLVLAVIAAIFFVSCKKEPITPTSSANTELSLSKPGKDIAYCGNVTVVDLMAGKYSNVGSVIVRNNSHTLFVTYRVNRGMNIENLNLFVGDFRLMPKTSTGNPIPGQFPYVKHFSESAEEYTFVIPLILVRDCYKVAAHATVSKVGEKGTESAWAAGEAINAQGNWGMYFSVCQQFCGGEEI